MRSDGNASSSCEGAVTGIRYLPLGERFDIAKGLAKQDKSVEEIARGAAITEAQAKLFWSREHPGDFRHATGLRKSKVEHEPWFIQTTKLLAAKESDDDQ